MSLIYFYDSTELDKQQLSEHLSGTDHRWEYVSEPIELTNLDPETEVISVFVSSTVGREVIEALPKLKLIACRSTGFNNIDLLACQEREITVVNVPTYGESTVAEYTFALLLALQRKIPQALEAISDQSSSESLRGSDLQGKTLGVIGTGHIGQRTIAIARGFQMEVIAYDPFPKKELANTLGFKYVDLDKLLAGSDVVSLHAPYNSSTHHLINRKTLELMKPSALIVNTARGELIDTSALVEALDNKQIAGAAIDVVEGEALLDHDEEITLLRGDSIPESVMRHSLEISSLLKLPNVIITPHMAFNTQEAIGRINQTTVQNIISYWYGQSPNIVQNKTQTSGKLIVIRHTESVWNASGQWTGIRDVHLSEKGFHEAALLGIKLRRLGLHIDQAFCSEQIRTKETLEGILNAAQMFDVPSSSSAAINERDYGDYTGKNKWEMKEILGEDTWNRVRRGWDEPIANGESLRQVYQRVTPFYLETVVPLLSSGKNVLIVAHGNSIRALIKYIEDISDANVAELEMLFGQIVTYEVNNAGLLIDKSVATINLQPPNA